MKNLFPIITSFLLSLTLISCAGGTEKSGSGNTELPQGGTGNTGDNDGSGNTIESSGGTGGEGNTTVDMGNAGMGGDPIMNAGGEGGNPSSNSGGDSGNGGDGGFDPEPQGGAGGGPDTCQDEELCNGIDDDCDGSIDEEPDNICEPLAENQNAICLNAQCVTVCDNGGVDCNEDPNLDPICIDDFETNPLHCGACNNSCSSGDCIESVCREPIQIAMGQNFSCAVLEGGYLKCWGQNLHGELAQPITAEDGTNTAFRNIPELAEQVMRLATPVHHIELGRSHGCAIVGENRNKLVCWGRNWLNQVTNDAIENAPPTLINELPAGESYDQIAMGHDHTCTLTSNGTLACWGGEEGFSLTFDGLWDEEAFGRIVDIDAGGRHTCVITEIAEDQSKRVYCWGENSYGQSGVEPNDAFIVDQPTLMALERLQTVGSEAVPTKLQAGTYHTCVRMASTNNPENGYVRCWGYNALDQLGKNTEEDYSIEPVSVSEQNGNDVISLSRIRQFSTSFNHSCFIKDNLAFCSGKNATSQIGRDSNGNEDAQWFPQQTPVIPVRNSEIQSIATGDTHSCAITRNTQNGSKSIWCWGSNQYGQLGSFTGFNSNGPIRGETARPQSVIWR